MSDDDFSAYIDRIMATKDRAVVVNLLSEFRDSAYLSGRHMLIDAIHSALCSYDDRQCWKKQ